MIARSTIIFRIAILSIFLFLLSCNQESRSGLNPGDYPPAIDLSDLNNKLHKLSDYRGKVLLVNFWATWCGPCVDELPAMQDLYNKLDKNYFEILAVGVDDSEEALREFKQRYSLTFPILVDKDSAVKSKYKLTGVPESFLLDKEGKLIMLPDISDNMPVVRIVGPRSWNTPNAISRIKDLINQGM